MGRNRLLLFAAPLLFCAIFIAYALGWIPTRGILITALLTISSLEIITFLWLSFTGHPTKAPPPPDTAQTLYSDRLLTITPDRLTFHHYGFFTSKSVLLADVQEIRSLRPTVANGKWRLGGTSDFQTWFPSDMLRFRRDTIFVAKLKTPGSYQIGFTVKDSHRVRAIFQQFGLLHPICGQCGYDLYATTLRCPECGAPIPADPAS